MSRSTGDGKAESPESERAPGFLTHRTHLRAAVRASTAAGCVVLIGACELRSADDAANGPDPIAALSSTTESTRYTRDFWAETLTRDPALWTRAVAVCTAAGGTERVNCAPVRTLHEIDRMARPPRSAPRPKIHMGVP